jgi:hypothetical protein
MWHTLISQFFWIQINELIHFIEVRFASFLSGRFITVIVLSKSTVKETGKAHVCVHFGKDIFFMYVKIDFQKIREIKVLITRLFCW